MGRGIAQVFAQHDWDTALIDVSRPALDEAMSAIRANLDRQVSKGGLAAAARASALADLVADTRIDPSGAATLVFADSTEPLERMTWHLLATDPRTTQAPLL